jgi:hypothetical protein
MQSQTTGTTQQLEIPNTVSNRKENLSQTQQWMKKIANALRKTDKIVIHRRNDRQCMKANDER